MGEPTARLYRRNGDGKWQAVEGTPKARKGDQWRGRVSVRLANGHRRDVSARGVTAQAARDAAEAKGRDLLRPATATPGKLTRRTPIVAACRSWLDDAAAEGTHARKTLQDYGYAFAGAIEHTDSPIVGLTVEQVNDAQTLRAWAKWCGDQFGPGKLNHARAVLTGTLDRAADWGVIPVNNLRAVRMKPPAQRKPTGLDYRHALSDDELDHLLTTARDIAAQPSQRKTQRKDEAVADLLVFMSGTGVRLGEALAVRWDGLTMGEDGAPRWAHVPGTKTRGSDRRVPLPAFVGAMLQSRAARMVGDGVPTSGLVFPSPGRLDPDLPWERVGAGRQVRKVFDAAGLDSVRSHSLRRTVGSRLIDAHGVRRAAQFLGHTDTTTTTRYYAGRDGGISEALADTLDR